LDGDDVYWLEGRPQEGGRYALVRWHPDGATTEVTPPGLNVRTRVHEYGGGAYTVRHGIVYFANFADQRVYRIEVAWSARSSGERPDSACVPEPLTPAGAWRYADFEVDAVRKRLICVREDHTQEGREPVNTIAAIQTGPAEAGHYGRGEEAGHGVLDAGTVLVSGYDFYSTPRLSPDGRTLAWLSWRHPAMPWDGTELWAADVDTAGALVDARRVAGGERESIYQPGWSPDGTLYYISDEDGWWKLYRSDRSGSDRSVVRNAPSDTEFGRPEWVFGTSTWAFAGPSRLIVSFTRRGRWHLGSVDVASGVLSEIAPGLQPQEWIAANTTHAVIVASSDTQPDRIVRIDVATGDAVPLHVASRHGIDPGYASAPEAIEFPTADGEVAHAFYYAPKNKDYRAPADEAPPLIAISHGGPTAAAEPTLSLEIQFWTSRGFALVDVNYRGSSGYGRPYRERLNGQWGIVDVVDVVSAAQYLCRRGLADARRLAIRGGSAGGYTTLAALTFHSGVFTAGASYYGISDLEVLEIDTHKFESRYSHSLVGPYPEARDVYRARSPIHFIDRLACPLILFQGLEDKVVPPNQSQMMADAVKAKGLPVAYLAFEGEQHGFRKAETIVRCLEAELYFYGRVFGFAPADRIDPVPISNS
jgi:dipeptidyl aminopeptidase/acylaminoacyl peptidase